MAKDKLRRAVRDLRAALGMTQTEFGSLIGKSLPTIQRYETLVPPKGKVLLKLERVARENRFDEHARILQEAIRTDLGLDLPKREIDPVALPFPIVTGVHVAAPESKEQKLLLDAFQLLLFQSTWAGPTGENARKEMKLVRRGLQRVLLQLEEHGLGEQPRAHRMAAIIRLQRDGLRAEQIAEKMHISKEQVEFVLSQYAEESE